jgi:pimeloyl-ACP methyl ester carboxylesterase
VHRLAILGLLVATATPSPPALSGPAACKVEGLSFRVACGTLRVRESTLSNRTIGTYFIVVPAARRNAGAVFVVGGGPGQSAVEIASGTLGGPSPYASLVGMHADHDIVFADQRGTGRSHPLQCTDLFASRALSFAELYPVAPLRACRAKLARAADLNAYGTTQAVNDLDRLRAALGYRTISIDTGSYGSEVAFEYMRLHPSSLRAVLLEAVVPTYSKVPLPFTRAAQHALDELEASCSNDVSCRKAYPNFASEWNALDARFATRAQPVTFRDGRGKTTAMLSREVFADSIRHVLYQPFLAAALPAVVHAAVTGNSEPLARLVAQQIDGFKDELNFGMFLSITCAENVAFITARERAAAAGEGFLGDLRIDGQRRACAIWNVAPAPRSFLAPVRSSVPVLMISGADDPAAPAWLGASQLPYLSNARQILVANGGHNNEDPCLARVRIAFVDDPKPARVRGSCATRYSRPAFVTDLNAWFDRFAQ